MYIHTIVGIDTDFFPLAPTYRNALVAMPNKEDAEWYLSQAHEEIRKHAVIKAYWLVPAGTQ